jgi:hypothetical protein
MISGGFSSVVCFAIAYPDPRQSLFRPRYMPLSTLLVLFMVLAARQGRESSLRRIRDVMLLENGFLLAIVRCWRIPHLSHFSGRQRNFAIFLNDCLCLPTKEVLCIPLSTTTDSEA